MKVVTKKHVLSVTHPIVSAPVIVAGDRDSALDYFRSLVNGCGFDVVHVATVDNDGADFYIVRVRDHRPVAGDPPGLVSVLDHHLSGWLDEMILVVEAALKRMLAQISGAEAPVI